jgi:hypothetical protein
MRQLINEGSAPAPIKMKYFEATMDGQQFTFEERLEMVREIGRKANEKFPKQYRSIQEWLRKYYLLFVFTTFW